mgnify:CR=1 FL=1
MIATISKAEFPTKNYYYVLLFKNEFLCQTLLNMTTEQLGLAMFAKIITLDDLERLMKNKVLALNVYYDNLAYTLIEEKPTTDIADLISNLGMRRFYFKNYF